MWVPGPNQEAVRDLKTRAREDIEGHGTQGSAAPVGAFLHRHGRVYHRKSRWTQAQFRWLENQRFDRLFQQVVFQEYVDVVL